MIKKNEAVSPNKIIVKESSSTYRPSPQEYYTYDSSTRLPPNIEYQNIPNMPVLQPAYSLESNRSPKYKS